MSKIRVKQHETTRRGLLKTTTQLSHLHHPAQLQDPFLRLNKQSPITLVKNIKPVFPLPQSRSLAFLYSNFSLETLIMSSPAIPGVISSLSRSLDICYEILNKFLKNSVSNFDLIYLLLL